MENHMKQCSYYSIIELKPPFKIFVIDCENEKAFLNIKLKAGQLQWCDYQHTSTDYRLIDKNFGLVIWLFFPPNFEVTVQADRRTNRRYQVHYFCAWECYTVDNNEEISGNPKLLVKASSNELVLHLDLQWSIFEWIMQLSCCHAG